MGLVSKPNTFVNGNNADPTQVNANFDVLYTLVNGNLDENNVDFSLATVKNSILTALKGVDGAGSGLNADLLDGKEYSEISTEIDTKINTAQNDAQNYSDSKISEHLPAGVITMWSGSIASIPQNWTLCNGENGTPDLRDKFIVAAGNSYDVGDTGGADSVTLAENQIPAHLHARGTLVNSSAGDHTHTFSDTSSSAGSHNHSGSANSNGNHQHKIADIVAFQNTYDFGQNLGGDVNANSSGGGALIDTNTAGAHTHSLSINSNGDHTHSVSGTTDSNGTHNHSISGSTANTGGGNSHENRPPYYALAYIMKI